MLGLTTTLQPRNTINVHVGLRKTKALLDTGAQISLVSFNFFQNSEFSKNQLLVPDYDVVRGVSGKHLPIVGKIQLPIDIENKVFWTSVHIVKGLNQSLILGLDFMEKQNVCLNLGSKTIKITDANITTPLETKQHFARTAQKVTIPSKHEMLIPVRISRLKRQQVVLLEPWGSLEDKSLLGAKTLSSVLNQRGVMKICNPTDNEITVGTNTIIATVEVIDSPCIQSFEKKSHINAYRPKKSNKSKKTKTPIDFDLTQSDLTKPQKEKLHNFLNDHRDIFATNLSELGRTVGHVAHKIITNDAPPVRMPFYRQPPHLQKEIDRQVQELLENDIIEESNSEYHSPVVLVKKKDGKFRFCVDYRKLNKITKPLSFPLPRLECVFDTVAEAKSQIFSTFDLHSGYWQLEMDPETKHKAAFITQKGVYEWKRLGMGLRNSCASFQMVMSQVLRGLHWKNMLVYVDDICVFSKNFDEHLIHLQQLFERLRSAGLTLKPTKCKFAAKQVKFLGHMISKEGIQVDPDKTKVIDTLPTPKTVKEVRSFLGMCNYYRRFIKSYSSITAPLTNLLKKDEDFIWTEGCETAFRVLKHKLTSAPILAHPKMNDTFMLTTDASHTAVGYILSQKDSGKREHVIAYGGRSLTKAERNWSASDIECLAVIEGIREHRTYLSNNEFIVYTDHKPLQYLMTHKGTTGRLARWSLELQGYNFQIVYKPGKSNVVADGLSRRAYPENSNSTAVKVVEINREEFVHNEPVEVKFEYTDPIVETLAVNKVEPKLPNTEGIARLQKECDDFKDIYLYLESEILPEEARKRKQVVAKSESYSLCNGVLYHWFQRRTRRVREPDRWIKQLALPKALRLEALKAYHDSETGGAHFGVEKVMAAVKQKYHWPKMHQNIYDYIQSCERCQRTKTDQHIRPPPQTPMPIDGPFERWHMDFLKLSKTKDGNQYLLLVVDSFTRWVEAFPMKNQESKSVAKVLFEQIFSRFGAPKKLVSDLGKQFTSNLILSLCEIFNVKKHFTSAYHPQTNSFCERNNRTIIQSIRAYCDKEQDNWPSKIPGILMALRNSPCTQSTKHSPYYLAFGREMNLPFDLQVTPKDSLQQEAKEHIREILSNLKITQDLARQNIADKQTKSKEYVDKTTKEPSFRLNQMVLLRQFKTPVGKSPKLTDKYDGPYYISELGPNFTYKLRRCSDHKEMKSLVNASRLRNYTNDQDIRTQYPEDGIGQLFGDENETESEDDENNEPDDQRDQLYNVEKLLRMRKRAGKRHFYVKWEDGSKTWEPEENLSDDLIREYFVTHTKQGKKRKFPSLLNKTSSNNE